MKLRVRCSRCDKEVRVEVGVHPSLTYHRCHAKRRRRVTFADLELRGSTPDEIRQAAWALLGGDR